MTRNQPSRGPFLCVAVFFGITIISYVLTRVPAVIKMPILKIHSSYEHVTPTDQNAVHERRWASIKPTTSAMQRPVSSLTCSQADIEKRSRTIVLTTSNAGFLNITLNMLESIKKTRACPNITIIAEDEESYRMLSKLAKSQPGLNVQLTDSGMTSSDKLFWGKKIYNNFVNKRPRYLLRFLELGYEVLFVDVDTFWLRDPFQDFHGNFDMAFHDEFKSVFCDGFAYYRPTENTLRVIREWVHLLETTNKGTPDQHVLNSLISKETKAHGLKVKTLDPIRYPDGRVLRDKGWKEKSMNKTSVLHMSYLLGYDAKVKKLKELGWWLI